MSSNVQTLCVRYTVMGSEILYLFLVEKIVVCFVCFVLFDLFVLFVLFVLCVLFVLFDPKEPEL